MRKNLRKNLQLGRVPSDLNLALLRVPFPWEFPLTESSLPPY